MSNFQGVYPTKCKDGTPNYRASFTYKGKHISLGGYSSAKEAEGAYKEALEVMSCQKALEDFSLKYLSFKKLVTLINFRDNGIYFKTPILIFKKFFYYYLSDNPGDYLIFDVDDLFYYSTHSIMRRGRHLFVADYGMQVNILSRYGIFSHAALNRDYYFANGNSLDLRYGNIIIINHFNGVQRIEKDGATLYRAKIHVNGDYVIGTYATEEEAAIAYNKAADILKSNGCKKDFPENYPESLSAKDYASIYVSVKISSKITGLTF